MKNNNPEKDQERQQLSPATIILLVLLVLCFCCVLVWAILPVNAEGPISAPLHASTQANYNFEDDNLIPIVKHSIIQDIILDLNPFAAAEIDERMATLEASLLTAVPSMTLSPNDQLTATVVALTETLLPPSTEPSLIPAIIPSLAVETSTPPPMPIIIIPPPADPDPDPDPDPGPSPAIRVTKNVSSYVDDDGSGSITYGDYLWFSYTVSNIGDTSLTSVLAGEVTFNPPITTVSCPGNTLLAGDSMVCTADSAHRVTLAEADAGSIGVNWGVASGFYGGNLYSDIDNLNVTISQNPSIEITKALNYYDDFVDPPPGISVGDRL